LNVADVLAPGDQREPGGSSFLGWNHVLTAFATINKPSEAAEPGNERLHDWPESGKPNQALCAGERPAPQCAECSCLNDRARFRNSLAARTTPFADWNGSVVSHNRAR